MCPIVLVLDTNFFPLGTCFSCAVSDKWTVYWHLGVCLVWNVCLVNGWFSLLFIGTKCVVKLGLLAPHFEWDCWIQTSPAPTSRTAGISPLQPQPAQPQPAEHGVWFWFSFWATAKWLLWFCDERKDKKLLTVFIIKDDFARRIEFLDEMLKTEWWRQLHPSWRHGTCNVVLSLV